MALVLSHNKALMKKKFLRGLGIVFEILLLSMTRLVLRVVTLCGLFIPSVLGCVVLFVAIMWPCGLILIVAVIFLHNVLW